MKWIVFIQVIVLSIEAKPGDERGISFEDCGKWIVLILRNSIDPATLENIKIHSSGSVYDVVRLNIGSCNQAPCYMPLRRNVNINAEFELIGEFIVT